MSTKWLYVGTISMLGALVLGACCPLPTAETELANPASIYCKEQGYTIEMRTDENGTYGVCMLPDGTECEEWAYYRGECGPREQAVDSVIATPPASPLAPDAPINVVELAGLRDTTEIQILEFAMADVSGLAQRATISDAGVIARLVAALDVDIPLDPRARCPTTYVVRFVLSDGSVVDLGYGCGAEAIQILRGEQGFWQGLDGRAPDGFSVLIQEQLAAAPQQTAVVGWYGQVNSLPAGGAYDDYIALVPEGAGEFGVIGADEAVNAQIIALRDKEEPGKYAHFWGTLTCGVDDYNGCQLVVARLRIDGPGDLYDADPVEGWEGLVVPHPSTSQWDDHFVLSGKYLVHYGISSPDPQIAAELERVRETLTPVRVWGEVTCGVMDTNGCQIEVTRIEIAGDPLSG
jgi:putative hemolysin